MLEIDADKLPYILVADELDAGENRVEKLHAQARKVVEFIALRNSEQLDVAGLMIEGEGL